ncbi:MAG: InlB B-repeat-containing protein [Erysipelotrichaceae bacterium]|nr:InlB B-repeat-containing protein [Erysipelotrichaceae bacterium]
MDDKETVQNEEKVETKKIDGSSFHNLYSKINIPIKVLDRIIAVLIAALFLALFFGIRNRGYTIKFDSQGGTYVENQKKMYGETIDYVIPEREGYKFRGWSLYQDCNSIYDENSIINDSIDLYACWIKE